MKIQDQSDRHLLLHGTSIVGDVIIVGIVLAIAGFGIAAAVFGVLAALIPAGLAVVFGGLLLWAVHHRTQARFDKGAGEFTLRKKMLHKTFERQIPLDKIVQADVDMKADRSNNNRIHPRYTYRLCVVTGEPAFRERVPVGHGYSSSQSHRIVAEKINAWLDVPEAPVGRGPGLEDIKTVVSALGFGRKDS